MVGFLRLDFRMQSLFFRVVMFWFLYLNMMRFFVGMLVLMICQYLLQVIVEMQLVCFCKIGFMLKFCFRIVILLLLFLVGMLSWFIYDMNGYLLLKNQILSVLFWKFFGEVILVFFWQVSIMFDFWNGWVMLISGMFFLWDVKVDGIQLMMILVLLLVIICGGVIFGLFGLMVILRFFLL